MWRRSMIVAAVLVGALTGTVVALQSPRVAENLREQVQLLAKDHLGLRVEIKALHLELLPPALAAEGVTVWRAGERDPWILLHRMRAAVRPWPSTAGALVVDQLMVDGLRVRHTLAGLPTDLAEGGPGAIPIDIRELALWNAYLDIDAGEHALHVEALDIEMTPEPRGGRRIALRLPHALVRVAEREFPFELRARAHLDGTLDRPKGVTLERARVFLPRVAFAASGYLPLGDEGGVGGVGDGPPGETRLAVVGDVDLEQLQHLVPELPAMRGAAQLHAELRGTAGKLLDIPAVRLEASVARAWVAGESLGDLDVSATIEGRNVVVESFRIDHSAIGGVTGSGSLDVIDRTVAFVARAHQVKLQEVLARAGLDDAWIRLLINGDLRGQGSFGEPLRIDLTADLTGSELAVLDRSHRASDAVEFLALESARVAGNATLRADGINLRGVRVDRGRTALLAEGFLSFDPAAGMELRVSAESFDVADVGPVAGVPFTGEGQIFAAIEGPYADPTISATSQLQELGFLGHRIGDGHATVIYEDLKLAIERAAFRSYGGTLDATVGLDFSGHTAQLSVEAELEQVFLASLLREVGVDGELSRRFKGRVSGTAHLTGALVDPAGEIRLQGGELTYDDIPLGKTTIATTLAPAASQYVRVAVRSRPAGGTLHADVGLGRAAQGSDSLPLHLEIDAQGVPLAGVRSLLGDIPVAGELDASAALNGPIDGLSGSIALTVPALDAWGYHLGRTRLTGHALAGRVAVSGDTLHGTALVGGQLIIGRELPYAIEASLTDLDIGQVYPLPKPVTIVASGSFFSQGDLTHAETIAADVRATQAKIEVGRYHLTLLNTARMTFGDGALEITDLGLQGSGLTLTLGGRIDTVTGLAMNMAAKGDVGIITPFASFVQRARGPFEAQVNLTGPSDAPVIDGTGRLLGASMRLATLQQDLTDIRAQIEFAGRNVEILQGTAKLGGGTLAFQGGALLANAGARPQLRLFSQFDSVRLRPQQQLSLTASGNLSLTGPMGDLLLKGRVDLAEMRYAKELELRIESFLPRRGAPLRVPDLAPPGDTIVLDVHVEAARNLHLAAGQLEAEFAASLDVRGDTNNIGLLGHVTPLWARARHRDLVFELVSGDIVFTEEFNVFGRYDLTAQAEGCNMLMTINITGDTRGDYIIDATGEDDNGPVHQQDPWSCISLGVRASQMAGNTAVSNSVGTEHANLGDALGGGLDILWGVTGADAKVRSIVPYVDEARITLGRSGKNRRTGPRLLVRKDVGNKLHVRYDGALDEADDHILSLEYSLTDNITVEGSWVSISDLPAGDFGLDLRLHLEFD